MKIPKLIVLVANVVLFASQVQAAMVTLYDGVGLPSNQAWLAFASDSIFSGGSATQSAVAGGVQLQSDLAVSAGYSNYTPFATLKNGSFPVLNRSLGIELNFALTLSNEAHLNNNRAGFSVILLGSDKQGIELGFWTNEIWAQSSTPLFQHSEGVSIDTTTQRNYRLQIINNMYMLYEGSNSLLSGPVRDYTGFNNVPYTLSNFLFLGDNTSSGSANMKLGMVTLQNDLSTIPEPSSCLLLMTGASIFHTIRRRRR